MAYCQSHWFSWASRSPRWASLRKAANKGSLAFSAMGGGPGPGINRLRSIPSSCWPTSSSWSRSCTSTTSALKSSPTKGSSTCGTFAGLSRFSNAAFDASACFKSFARVLRSCCCKGVVAFHCLERKAGILRWDGIRLRCMGSAGAAVPGLYWRGWEMLPTYINDHWYRPKTSQDHTVTHCPPELGYVVHTITMGKSATMKKNKNHTVLHSSKSPDGQQNRLIGKKVERDNLIINMT